MDDAPFVSLGSKNNLDFQGELQVKEDFIELLGKHFLNKGIYFFGKKIGQEIKGEEEEIIHLKKIYYDNELRYAAKYGNFKSFGDGVIYKNNKVYYKGGFAFGKKKELELYILIMGTII
jgi:hypothetical protein